MQNLFVLGLIVQAYQTVQAYMQRFARNIGPLARLLQVIRTETYLWGTYDFLLVVHSKYLTYLVSCNINILQT